MNAIDSLSPAQRIKFRKETNGKELDAAIEVYIRAYEDARDRGISKNDMRDLVSDLVNLFYAKWEMD